jgi:peptide/nickel transport system substrate-binding protein
VTLVAVAGVLAGCGAPPAAAPLPSEIRIGFSAFSTSRGEGLRLLSGTLYGESLLTLGWDGQVIPLLAESWEWLDAGRTLRLQLRPGLKFHDGQPVTSQVVSRIIDAQIARLRENSAPGFDYVEKVQPLDERVVVITMSRPDTFLINSLDQLLITEEKDGRSVGTGPFVITPGTPPASGLVAERFAGYHRGPAGIARVKVVPYDTQRSAFTALMRGDVDMVPDVARESVEFLQGASRIDLYPSLRPFYVPLVFSLRHPVFRRVEVRRALSEAIDRDQIVKVAMRGHGRVAQDPVWPHHWAYSAATRAHGYNPEAVRLRLDAMGLPVRPAPAGSNRMASRFRFTCLYWSEDPEFERIALLVQRQLAAVGVDMVLEPVQTVDLSARVGAGNFEAHLFRMNGGRSFASTYYFWHSPEPMHNTMHDSGYSGSDAILERIRVARTDDETRRAVSDLQQQFYDDAPAIFLAWLESTRAVDAQFALGQRNDPDIFAHLWQWRPTGQQQASR